MKSILSALFVVAAATFALSAPAAAQTFEFTGFMIGANEVSPVVGDADASATGFVSFNTTNQTVTYSLTNIQNLQSNFRFWHIHTGAAGANGSVLVDFGNSFSGTNVSYASVGATVAEVLQISTNPGGHYFNAHTDDHPGGAIRAQLAVVPEAGTLSLVFGAATVLGAVMIRRRK